MNTPWLSAHKYTLATLFSVIVLGATIYLKLQDDDVLDGLGPLATASLATLVFGLLARAKEKSQVGAGAGLFGGAALAVIIFLILLISAAAIWIFLQFGFG